MKANYIFFVLLFYFSMFEVQGQSIDHFLQQAFDNNPELKALRLEYEAALKKGAQVSQLPNPVVGVGVPILRPETRLGGQVFMISASQLFPWFGTLKAKEDIALTMAETKYEDIAAIRLNLIFQIKNAYYNLYFIHKKQHIIRKHIRLFETMEKVSLANVESGKSNAADVLGVRIKIEELNNRLAVLDEQKQIHEGQINAVINAQPGDTIVIVDSLTTIAAFSYNINAYKQKIQSFHPLIKQLDWQMEISQQELELNTLAGKPSLGLGLDYSMVNNRTDAFPAHNGRDILIPKVMVSLPLYRDKYQAKKEEERLKQEAYMLRKSAIENNMLGHIQTYKAEYESARLMRELAIRQITISERAFDMLLSEYSSKGRRFDELIRLRNDIINYELEIVKAIVQTHMAKIKIDKLTDF